MRAPVSVLGFIIFGLFSYWLAQGAQPNGDGRTIAIAWVISSNFVALLSLFCAFYQVPSKLFWILASLPILVVIGRFCHFGHSNQLAPPVMIEVGAIVSIIIWLFALSRLNNDDIMC